MLRIRRRRLRGGYKRCFDNDKERIENGETIAASQASHGMTLSLECKASAHLDFDDAIDHILQYRQTQVDPSYALHIIYLNINNLPSQTRYH
jgi:hypothetical protein